MKVKERIRCGVLLLLFLCLEFAAFSVGGKAFYSTPVEISLAEGAPLVDGDPILPQQGWTTQQQWFIAEGDYLNRLTFSVMGFEGNGGGFTIELQDEKGTKIAEQHYAGEELWEGVFTLEVNRALTRGGRYCFSAVADNESAGWAVPYFHVPGGELSAWEDASLDGAPMGGGLHYLFLSFFFARISWVAVCLHIAGAVGGAAYFLFFRSAQINRAYIADAAMLCVAGACAVGQLFLCKNYYLTRALFLCLPCVSLVMFAFWRLMENEKTQKWFRLSARSFKTWLFLGTALLTGLMILYSIRGNEVNLIVKNFSIAAAALLVFLFFGIFETPGIDRFCARFPWVIYGAVSILIFLQMEVANANSLATMRAVMAAWNVLTIFAIFMGLWALCGNFRIAGLIGMFLFEVWGFANYLTVDFRGIPIMPNDLMSAGTALNVLGGYHVTIRMKLAAFWALFILIFILLLRIPYKSNSKKRIHQRIAVFLCVAVFFWQGYFGALELIDMLKSQGQWRMTYYPNGYTAVSIAKIKQLFTVVPAGYSASEVQQLLQKGQARAEAAQPDTGVRPNVILILNESWFDWRQMTDFETDQPAMPFIDGLENSIKGFAVGPEENAGTSLSEYELLTSNCLDLMPGLTPFTQRNLEGSYSVVSYIKDLGYTTTALHPAPSTNYSRQMVYPQLGFERAEFLEDGIWINRLLYRGLMSDSGTFDAVEEVFEEKTEESPAFIYLLTIQNHGDYNSTRRNGGSDILPEEYEINLISGFDSTKGEAEEYLSMIRCTDAAFEELIQYFAGCDEPTILCMVGDHAPYFGEVETSYESYERSMRQRGTPFVIWANYPIESYDAGYIGMAQLVPLLMKTAGLPLSPYYQTLLALHEEYPMLCTGFYQDAQGNFGDFSYKKEIPQSELLKQYFYFEYNSLLAPDKRIGEIFLAG